MRKVKGLSEENPKPGIAVLLNHNHPVSQDQFDRIFKGHHHDVLYVAAIQRPEWMPTTEQIELLSKKSADVIRALTERDDVAFTREQVLAGLSRVESKDCMVYALSFNFEMDTEIAEIGLSNPFADVRWAFARRKDYTPTKAQFKIMLQDEVAKVRYAALNRSDIVLDDELMACRKLDISEAEHDMWRQAIARQAAIVTDGCRKGVRRI